MIMEGLRKSFDRTKVTPEMFPDAWCKHVGKSLTDHKTLDALILKNFGKKEVEGLNEQKTSKPDKVAWLLKKVLEDQ